MPTYDELYQQHRRKDDDLFIEITQDDIDRLKHRIEAQTMVPVTKETE